MPTHITGTRDQWLKARLDLLQAEKELTRRSDELARLRQDLPWVRVEKTYRFETDEGSATLADLFRGRSQLLVYHFMFGPDYTAGCLSCSAIADGFSIPAGYPGQVTVAVIDNCGNPMTGGTVTVRPDVLRPLAVGRAQHRRTG